MSSDVQSANRLNEEPASPEMDASPAGRRAALPHPDLVATSLLDDGRTVTLRRAQASDVEAMLSVMHDAFGARPALGNRPEALSETATTLAAALARGAGYLAEVGGRPAATVVVTPVDGAARLGRVSVHPDVQRHGVASFVVQVLLEALADAGESEASLLCRREFPQLAAWWRRHGFEAAGQERDCWVMRRALPVVVEAPDADAMRALGRRVAGLLRAGDLLIVTGELGAGKTTFAQGLGAGLQVAGPIISPTFVLSRVHPSTVGGPALVHVDAYRLGGSAELEDLDLEASLDSSVTLVEWGADVAESLASHRLEVDIRRGLDPADETRAVFLTPIGARWDRAALASVAAASQQAADAWA